MNINIAPHKYGTEHVMGSISLNIGIVEYDLLVCDVTSCNADIDIHIHIRVLINVILCSPGWDPPCRFVTRQNEQVKEITRQANQCNCWQTDNIRPPNNSQGALKVSDSN